MKVEVIRTDGTHETHTVTQKTALQEIYLLIGCRTIDTVTLPNGMVMLVDDDGYEVEVVDHGTQPDPRFDGRPTRVFERKCVHAKKPVNHEATQLYWARCRPGTTHQIVGDVAVVRDEDFS